MNHSHHITRRLVILVLTLAALLNGMLLPIFSPHRVVRSVSADAVNASATGRATAPSLAAPDEAKRARVSEAYGKLPMGFERNVGQFDAWAQFAARGKGYMLYLSATEAVMALRSPAPAEPTDDWRSLTKPQPSGALRMKLVGASRTARSESLEELSGKSNYFIGNDPQQWRTNVSQYAKVRYAGVYRGIDVVYYGDQGKLEYDFNVAAGANPAAIRLALAGAKRIRIDANGELVLSMAGGEVRQHRPIAYQVVNGRRQQVAARYILKGRKEVSFALARYDARQPLVIDPVLSYSTHLGGNGDDVPKGIAVDTSGNAYVTGWTVSSDFPTANPFQPRFGNGLDVFITKLNATGTALIYSTYLGGNSNDDGRGIAIDAAGNAYITGMTISDNFPTFHPLQMTRSGDADAFIVKLNSTGSALDYATYLGGTRSDFANAIALDAAGEVCITGPTSSSDFPIANARQPMLSSTLISDAFVTKLNAAGSALIYSTYHGGVGGDNGFAVAMDAAGNAYVTGSTNSSDFPTANPLQSTYHGKTAFKSVNGGDNWSSINNGLPTQFLVNTIAIDPANSATLYLGTSGGGLFKSTDGGSSWNAANNGLNATLIRHIAIDPVTPSRLYTATISGVFLSTDGGGNWSLSTTTSTTHLAINPQTPTTLFGARAGSGMVISTNGGQTWGTIPDNTISSVAVRSIIFDPTNPNTMYAGTNSVFPCKSTDGGHSWFPLSGGISAFAFLAINPLTPSTIYGTGPGAFGVSKSTDSGATWKFLPTGQTSISTALAVDPANPDTIYVSTSGSKVIKSTDGGSSWHVLGNLNSSLVNALAVDPHNPATVYVGSFQLPDAFVSKFSPTGNALLYSTFLGGDDGDSGTGIAVDASGNAYVMGNAFSTNFPTVNPAQANNAGLNDVFMSKLDSTGTVLIASTYLGGNGTDAAEGLAIDPAGNAYLTGFTGSSNFPTLDSVPLGTLDGFNAFVTKLHAGNFSLAYSTYLGGNNVDDGHAIAIDAEGNAYVVGETASSNFPTTPGAFQPIRAGFSDAFVTKLSSFDICVQDDRNGYLLRFNSTSGDYQFFDCRKRITLSGRGTVSVRGCKIDLRASSPSHSLTATVNSCTHVGTASLQSASPKKTYTLNDPDITNNTCACQ